jgi:hypothetical protein
VSYSWHVRSSWIPTISDLLVGTALDGVDCAEDPDDASTASLSDDVWHLYQVRESARTVEVDYQDGRVGVRLMTLSAPAELEIALRVLELVASRGDGTFGSEDTDEDLPLSTLRERFDAAWLAAQNDSGTRSILALLAERGENVTIPGVVRDVVLGPRTIGELVARGPDGELARRVVDKIRAVQWLDIDDAFEASVMSVSRADDPDASRTTIAVWGPDVRYLFPQVQFLVVREDPGSEASELLWVPFEALAAVADGAFEHQIDEVQALVDATPAAGWADLVARARAYAVDPP